MKKTCYNCEYFHGCLGEGDSYYHIHDYCEKFNMVLEKDFEIEVNRFLDDHWVDMEEANPEHGGVYNDFETGEAGCWMFAEADEKTPDVIFEDRKRHNRLLAIKTIKHMLETNETYDKCEQMHVRVDDQYGGPGDEDYDWLVGLLARLEGEENEQ